MTIVATNNDPVRASSGNLPSWREAMKRAVRDPKQLCQLLDLPLTLVPDAVNASQQFPLFAPREYIQRMEVGNAHDPLLRQVLPMRSELAEVDGYSYDPVGDATAAVTPSLLHKYHGRTLLVTTGQCAIHCRYCFRRHYPYSESPPSIRHWEKAIERIEADASIDEVLLSGGDPLTLVDPNIAFLYERLSRVAHVSRVRIHSRLPIVIPQRITDHLVRILTESGLQSVMVVHANHPNEMDEAVVAALQRLSTAGVMLLNQSVLLRNVNDNAETLIALSHALIANRVIPYYLHELDRVSGAAHFAVARTVGLQIIDRMREKLPGYAVPRFVRELPGESHKRVLA